MMYLKFRLKVSLTALFFLTLFLSIPFPLCDQSAEHPVRVAARICPPFVMKDAGHYSGLSIFLLDNIAGKLGFEYLQEKGINSRTFSDRKELLAALDDGRLDAVVSDDAVLRYKIKEAQAKGRYESLSVLPFVFEKQNYAFALPDESPYLEELNQALLSARDSPEWSVELVKCIGKE